MKIIREPLGPNLRGGEPFGADSDGALIGYMLLKRAGWVDNGLMLFTREEVENAAKAIGEPGNSLLLLTPCDRSGRDLNVPACTHARVDIETVAPQ